MYDNALRKNFRIRSTFRFNRPASPFPRFPGNFTRRPFPTSRKRMMSIRYPNRGDRPLVPSVFRPDFPNLRGIPHDYGFSPPPVNPTYPATPPGMERSEFPNFGIQSPYSNRNIYNPVSPDTIKNDQNVMESHSVKFPPMDDLNLSELWIEAMAPNRRIYYYNARTRETKWEKPLNVRIIDLDEIKRLTSKPAMEQTLNLLNENQNSFVKATPSTCINPCIPAPRNFVMPQRYMFPPPPNICPPPQIICTPPVKPFQNASMCSFNIMVPPPIFPLPMITESVVPKLEVDYSSNATTAVETKSFVEKSNTLEHHAINEECILNEKRASEWSTSDSKLPLSTLGNTYYEKNEEYHYSEKEAPDCNISGSKGPICTLENAYNEKNISEQENAPQMDLDKTSDQKNISEKKDDTPPMDLDKSADSKTVNSNPFESECTIQAGNTPLLDEPKTVCTEGATEENEKKIVDKSRPVSSTPISGTCWSVVWTGDEKVFFYNSLLKISVWNRPEELFNRPDIDKLIEKPHLTPQDVKSGSSSLGSSVASASSNVLPFNSDSNESCIDRSIISSNLCTTSVASNMPCTKKSYESNATFCVKKMKTNFETEEKPSELNQNVDCAASSDIENKGGQSASEEISHELRVKIFREMLVEKKVSAFSTWEKELHKIVFDSRYLLLPSKERKQMFESYMQEKLEEEKNDRYKELQNQREKFRSLLKEAGITSKSRFNDFAQHYSKDVRFKSIEKIKQKEHMFNQYVFELIKNEKELEKRKLEQKKNFIQLLNEQKDLNKNTPWSEIEEKISNHEFYKSIQSKSLKEKLFKEYINECQLSINSSSSNNRDDRASTSIRNREEQVKRDLSIHLKDREREQELHKHKSAVSNFKALLNDLIKNSDISWHSAKKSLKEDHRWNYSEFLKTEEREDIFNEHIDSLNSKKKEQFHRLLDEIPDMSLKTSWLDIRKVVLGDPRCTKFSSSERKCEKEFKDYLKQKVLAAKHDFKQLLKETKIITYKSKSLLKNSNHLRDIEDALSKDKRYLILECMRGERKEILLSYIDNLHNKGPPPPPTATEPSNRM